MACGSRFWVSGLKIIWRAVVQDRFEGVYMARELRIPLSFRRLFLNAGCVVKNTRVMASTTAAGVGFGAQLLFLSTAQSVFSQIYPTGDMFAVYFAALAASTGLATPANSGFVSTVGMQKMVFYGAGGHVVFGFFLLLTSFCTTRLLHFSGLWRCSLR
jgi:DHA1 family bicyclomycin/chloramphenicol resistance-like MFS transporter